MIISVNWLKKFTDIDMPIDQLTTLIGARLVEIESVTDLSEKYKDVIIVRVAEAGPLEGTDHLNLTKIDDGGVVKDVERDSNGFVQVVCGAPNVRVGMLAAWLPPSAVVPETFGDAEPFVLTAKNLRGVVSNGMLASAKELDLFDDHTGIIEIDKEVVSGSKFADVYELNDYLLDIENKSLTHRPDTFGIIGFAREVAAISGKAFVTPEWLAHVQPEYGKKTGSIETPKIVIDNPDLSARYQAVVMGEADGSRHSPLEIQTYLARVGVRPINAVVDVTNYLMMLTGQPLHAFDYDKLLAVSGGKNEIHVRGGKKGETLELLDGRVIELAPEDIVIAAGDTAVGLAGAMGGANTVIDDTTKNIIVESATFNLYSLRATQMRHGIFSEAITRFTKGQPAALGAPVLADAVTLMEEWAGAKRQSDVGEAIGTPSEPSTITITTERINRLLGTTLTTGAIEATLRLAEFAAVQVDKDTLSVDAPFWRADIHIPEDIIEEVGRIGGYDLVPLTVPARDFTAVSPSAFDQLRTHLRNVLVRAGANEVLTYSFVHGDLMKKAGQDETGAYRITNSISPDLQYYRQSIVPSLLSQVHPNIKAGYGPFALFELNKFHTKRHEVTDEKVPKELDSMGFVIASKKSVGSAYYDAKYYLTFIAEHLGLTFAYSPLEADSDYPVTQPFEPKRSARIFDQATGERIGVVGEFKASVKKAFKLPDHVAGFEISPRALLTLTEVAENSYTPLSKYPGTERDICFKVADDITYGQIVDVANEALSTQTITGRITPVDIYQPEDKLTKNITIRIALTAVDRTLTGDDASMVVSAVTKAVIAATDATVI